MNGLVTIQERKGRRQPAREVTLTADATRVMKSMGNGWKLIDNHKGLRLGGITEVKRDTLRELIGLGYVVAQTTNRQEYVLTRRGRVALLQVATQQKGVAS
jgi:hypothetical protein